MAFNWIEYLNLARFLECHKNLNYEIEAGLRTAVSRSYYAAFCYARNYAADYQGYIKYSDAKDHQLLRDHFNEHKNTKIAIDLDQLRNWRNKCDYEDNIGNPLPHISLMAKSSIHLAQNIIDLIKKLPH